MAAGERFTFSPKCKFDHGHRPVFEFQIFIIGTPAQFDQLRLSANNIGRTMKNMRGGNTTAQLAVDIDVIRD